MTVRGEQRGLQLFLGEGWIAHKRPVQLPRGTKQCTGCTNPLPFLIKTRTICVKFVVLAELITSLDTHPYGSVIAYSLEV